MRSYFSYNINWIEYIEVCASHGLYTLCKIFLPASGALHFVCFSGVAGSLRENVKIFQELLNPLSHPQGNIEENATFRNGGMLDPII